MSSPKEFSETFRRVTFHTELFDYTSIIHFRKRQIVRRDIQDQAYEYKDFVHNKLLLRLWKQRFLILYPNLPHTIQQNYTLIFAIRYLIVTNALFIDATTNLTTLKYVVLKTNIRSCGRTTEIAYLCQRLQTDTWK